MAKRKITEAVILDMLLDVANNKTITNLRLYISENHRLYSNYYKTMLDNKLVIKKDGYIVWNTIPPNIHMASKLRQLSLVKTREYTQRHSEKKAKSLSKTKEKTSSLNFWQRIVQFFKNLF